jgi:hypothetical protein
VKRILFFLVASAACGGRTTLDDSIQDASIIGQDGGVIGKDGGPIQGDAQPPPPPPPEDGGPPPPPPIDAGPPPGNPIDCGNATCNSSTEVCCVTFNGQTLNEACTPQGQCNGAPFACSSASSCSNGDVCCASFTQQKQSSQCQPKCQGGFQNPQLCATSAECPQGTTCKPSPFGFSTCRP